MTDKRDAWNRDADHPTAGTNSRPLNDTIGQTGGGVPDDSSEQVEVEPEEQKRMEARGLLPASVLPSILLSPPHPFGSIP